VGRKRHTPADLSPRTFPVCILEETGWTPEPVCKGIENRTSRSSTGFRTPAVPARGESQYRVSFPGSASSVYGAWYSFQNLFKLQNSQQTTSPKMFQQTETSPIVSSVFHCQRIEIINPVYLPAERTSKYCTEDWQCCSKAPISVVSTTQIWGLPRAVLFQTRLTKICYCPLLSQKLDGRVTNSLLHCMSLKRL
jgi:hypothetical protein